MQARPWRGDTASAPGRPHPTRSAAASPGRYLRRGPGFQRLLWTADSSDLGNRPITRIQSPFQSQYAWMSSLLASAPPPFVEKAQNRLELPPLPEYSRMLPQVSTRMAGLAWNRRTSLSQVIKSLIIISTPTHATQMARAQYIDGKSSMIFSVSIQF